MTDAWIALCDEKARDSLRGALGAHDPSARLSFAGDAQELRQWAQEANGELGVMVGPLAGSISSVNVAAAIAHDESASCVALATHEPTTDLAKRAKQAGIDQLVDLGAWEEGGCEVEEPLLPSDEVPTMLFPSKEPGDISALLSVPRVDDRANALDLKGVAKTCDQPAPEPHVEERARPHRVGNGADHGGDGQSRRELTMKKAPVVALFSGRGGVGKTSIVATMGHAASSWGLHVALCDLDLPFGNLYSCFGLSGPASMLDASGAMLADEHKLIEAGVHISEGLELWGSTTRPEMSELVAPHVEDLLDMLARSHDLVLVDTSSTFDDAVAQVAQACDRMLLVADGRPGSNVAQARLGSLAVRLGVARTRIACVANRCSARGKGDASVNRSDVGLETARVFRVTDGGNEVASCLARGNPAELFELGSRFADSTSHALAQLLAELGALPEHAEAKRALERKETHTRWTFGRKREGN